MKNIKKGVLHVFLVLAAIGAMAFIAFVGIGKAHKGSAKNIRLGLDLAGGVSITYQTVKEKPTSTEMSDTIYKLRKRVDAFSTEADIYQEGGNRINIDIPDVKDPNEVLDALGKAGSLQFVDPNGEVVIDGSDVETATPMVQQDPTTGASENVVKLVLKSSGRKKFKKATAEFIGQPISIVYDGETISSPTVESEITNGEAVISGSFDEFSKAEELASTIRIGALPLELKEIRSNVVGAKLGLEAINTSLLAGVIGLFLVILFMIAYYRLPGFASSIALIFYVGATLVVLNGLNITLTLPGVAGIILGVGMAVDANVIIFTRIKEELATGKTVRSAIKLGFDKALSAIIDGNVTTLIAAVVLYFKGSGTVKGFAQTLAIGIILSMFTALFVTKFLLDAFYNLGADNVKLYGVQKPTKVFNFTGNTFKFYAISGTLFAVCIGALIFNMKNTGSILNYSLEFMGGTSTELTFPDDVNVDDAKMKEVEDLFKDETGTTAEISDIKGVNAITVRTTVLDKEQRKALEDRLVSDLSVERESIQMESISATVSDGMRKDAIIAVVIAAVCMLVYIWFRFKDIRFGASAVLALIHDCIIVLMVYAVFSRWILVGNTFIACMLTILGYSINATIIVFDRIRENLRSKRSKDSLADVVNLSVSQTISRNINTSLTTFITVFMLAILGVDSVRQFAIPLIVGIVCGAYSSICITGPLWYQLKKAFSKA